MFFGRGRNDRVTSPGEPYWVFLVEEQLHEVASVMDY